MASYRISVTDEAPTRAGPEGAPMGSFFGHDPGLRVIVPAGHDLPVQLMLTLDSGDARVAALGTGVGPAIRLVHPFHYSQGETFAYRHRDDGAVEFTVFPGNGDPSWPSMNPGLPAAFPARAVRFETLEGKPERDGVGGDASGIYLGDGVPTIQDYSGLKCVACSTGEPRLVASVPSRPMPGLDVWDNDFIFVLFWHCPSCKAITTHNECD